MSIFLSSILVEIPLRNEWVKDSRCLDLELEAGHSGDDSAFLSLNAAGRFDGWIPVDQVDT